MAQISITVENMDKVQHYLRTRPEAMRRELATALNKSAILVQREARKESPVDTGRLRSGVAIKLSPLKAVVSPKSKYALYVHEGTGIYARNGKGRKTGWFVKSPKGTMDGKDGTKGFWTRGQKPNPFMERAAKSSESRVNAFFQTAIGRVAEGR